MKKNLLFALAALVALVSCQKEDIQNGTVVNEPEPLVFTASIAQDDTKATVDIDGSLAKIFWESTDKITITDGSSHVATYKVSSGAGTKTATFVKESGDNLDSPGTYTATFGEALEYPQYYSSTGSVPIHMTAPSTSSTDGLCFKADCGVLCVSLTVASRTIMRIEVSDGSQAYKVTAPAGVVNPSAEKFYLALPEGTYSTLNIYDNANYVCSKTICLDIIEGHIRPASNTSAMSFAACTTKGFDGLRAWVKLWSGSPKWAETNVGATIPEESGDYYAWGATETLYTSLGSDWAWKNYYGYVWRNAPFNGGEISYNLAAWNAAKSSAIDASNNLLAANDVASQVWGSPWRMPTQAECAAMLTNCDCTWCTDSNHRGLFVVGKGEYSSCSIFLPGAGFCSSSPGIVSADVGGYYWSSSLSDYSSNEYAWALNFSIDDKDDSYYGSREKGYTVRPVCE